MTIEDLQQLMLAYTMLLPRFMACFVIMPILGKQMLGGAMIRNGVVCSLALFAYPSVADSLPSNLAAIDIMLLIVKEVVLGLVIGFIATIPFWAVESCGFIIDNQRGAAMASVLNPTLGSQTSPTGLLLTQTLITLFFVGGAFLSLLAALYQSYLTWPVLSLFPLSIENWVDFFYSQFARMLELGLLLAAPLLIAMFVAEFGLALISRFAPSLNVFILAMPIKSAIASFLLVVYIGILMEQSYSAMLYNLNPIQALKPIVVAP